MNNKKTFGFTLLELLLYISLLSIVIFSISSFFNIVIQSRIKNKTILEVEYQGSRVIQIISQTIKNAQGINYPLPNNSGNSLSINTGEENNNQIIFTQSNRSIIIKQGENPEINLTSPLISVNNLNFRNLSRTGTYGNIYIEFTLEHKNNQKRKEYDYSKTFQTAISLRQ
jgi:type II secretory pathway component PulJ